MIGVSRKAINQKIAVTLLSPRKTCVRTSFGRGGHHRKASSHQPASKVLCNVHIEGSAHDAQCRP